MLAVLFRVGTPQNMVRRVQPHIWGIYSVQADALNHFLFGIFRPGRTAESQRGLVHSSLVPEPPHLPAYIHRSRLLSKRNTEMHRRHGNRPKEIDYLVVKRSANAQILSEMVTGTDYRIAIP